MLTAARGTGYGLHSAGLADSAIWPTACLICTSAHLAGRHFGRRQPISGEPPFSRGVEPWICAIVGFSAPALRTDPGGRVRFGCLRIWRGFARFLAVCIRHWNCCRRPDTLGLACVRVRVCVSLCNDGCRLLKPITHTHTHIRNARTETRTHTHAHTHNHSNSVIYITSK